MTITSNIHVGLAAWTNHTFTLGEDCSNAGNAYRCITAGTSTAAPTGTSSNVDNGGAAHFKWLSAIDFTSYNAWWTAITTPTTQPVIGQIWNHGVVTATLATAIMTFSGKTTTSTNNITLTCAPGESFRDAAAALTFNASNGVAIQLPASGTGSINYIDISNNNFIMDGIQFRDPNSASVSTILSISGSGNRIQNCIFDGFSQASGGAIIMVTGLTAATGLVLENILFIDRATTGRNFMFNAGNATDTVHIVNCTGISTTNIASGACFNSASSTSSTFIIRNCAVFGYPISGGIAGSVGPSATVIDHCVSDATGIGFSATDGGSNLFSKTAANQFVSSTTNFKLKAGADCLSFGVVDTTDIPAGDDVFRTARGVTWDVGAFELVSGFSVLRDYIASADIETTVIRSLGRGGGSPWSTGFSTGFGPAGNSGGIGLEWGMTVVRDLGQGRPWSTDFSLDFGPAPSGVEIEFGSGIFNDRVLASEFGRITRRDSTGPVDLSSVVTVSNNAANPLEWMRSVAGTSHINPTEWRSSIFRDFIIPDDTASLFTTVGINQIFNTEWDLSARRDDGVTLETGTVRFTQPTMPIEWKASFLSDTRVQIEPNSGVFNNTLAPIEWMSSAVMMNATAPLEFGVGRFRDTAFPVEFATSPFIDAFVPVDWSQPGQIGSSIIISVEFTNRIFETSSPQTEFNKIALVDRVIPTEWTGNTGTTLDALAPVEWRSTISEDSSPSVDWRATFSVDAEAPIFELSSFVASHITSIEFSSVVFGDLFVTPDSASETRSRDFLSPIEFGATRTRDSNVPVALDGSANGVTGDTTTPLEFSASAAYQIIAPIDNSTPILVDIISRASFTITMFSDPAIVNETMLSTSGETASSPEAVLALMIEDMEFTAEWLSATVSMDMVFQVAYGREVASDYVPSADWLSQFSSDVIALIEWTQDTTVMTTDAATPMDFLSITVTDVVISPEMAFGRDTFGSQLEPDEWEKEHE